MELQQSIIETVRLALAEDIGAGDITAQLVPAHKQVTARVITREAAVICGQAWVNEVFRQVDPSLTITWQCKEGEQVAANTVLLTLSGNARSLLSAERSALNFLQLLSGTATVTRQYVDQICHTKTRLLDTRKTIIGLRLAQKYAVRCGGGKNHRMGLYDAFLIKENHIAAAGSITAAVQAARKIASGKPVEVEVENLKQLAEAITAKADIAMLDNFDLTAMREAVALNQDRLKLEVSGNVTLATIRSIAETGIDYISVGAITKNLQAIDLSMRFIEG